ncbi:hypothetical protein PR202_ga02740 [Eleusine coracana subsp. coracana]|uniref:Uncharacterized protein n=1 Tax=Eleusine coracana subsp. coracana TaxID=191504 RepID=A0AAV5BMC3_ELECO|nr:hypothetical protein PR202_ga02740 [Eleusine coracana subsp. coracana]
MSVRATTRRAVLALPPHRLQHMGGRHDGALGCRVTRNRPTPVPDAGEVTATARSSSPTVCPGAARGDPAGSRRGEAMRKVSEESAARRRRSYGERDAEGAGGEGEEEEGDGGAQ